MGQCCLLLFIYLLRVLLSPFPVQLEVENKRNTRLLLVYTAFVVKRCLEAVDGESHDAGKDGRGAVDQRDDDGVPLAVVAGIVVAGVGDEAAEAQAQREEDLCGGADPRLGV